MKLTGRKSALTPTPIPNPRWFILLTVLKRWSWYCSYPLLLCCLFYEAICLALFLFSSCFFCLFFFSVLLALQLPRLEKGELILVLFVRLFDLRMFGFVSFVFPLGVWEGLSLVIVAVPGCFSTFFVYHSDYYYYFFIIFIILSLFFCDALTELGAFMRAFFLFHVFLF